ncbi:MAG: carboxypeptidase regulatory-like domain-containing protein, partial [Candidatus Zixiibacteriota bacterium]
MRSLILVVSVVLFSVFTAFAQDPLALLMGTVTDEIAAPIESVFISGGGYSDYTDENGDYFIEMPHYGLNFTFTKPTYYDTTLRINVFDDTVIVDMTMRTLLPGVRGKVIDVHPAEVESVMVSVMGTSFYGYSDDNGDFVVENLDPGIYDVSFSHPFYFDTVITDVLADSGLEDYYQVILTSKSAVTGQVFNLQDSLPLSDVHISTYYYYFNIEGLSDSTGHFIVRPVPGRLYQLVLKKRNYFEQIFPGIAVGVAETMSLGDIYMEPYPGDVNVWYGNPDGSPVTVPIDATIFIDLYCQTADSVYIGFVHMPLGTDDQYIIDYYSETLGILYYPLTEWDDVCFRPPYEYNQGWHSQSLIGFYDIQGGPNPALHYTEPTRIATYAFKTANDSSLIGDTVYCFTEGLDPAIGGPIFGGADAVTLYYPVHHFSPLYFSDEAGNCFYTIGDVNGSWSYNGLDIIYAVNYFKGGSPPPYDCECTAGNTWYVVGDVNASCDFNGLDITYGV